MKLIHHAFPDIVNRDKSSVLHAVPNGCYLTATQNKVKALHISVQVVVISFFLSHRFKALWNLCPWLPPIQTPVIREPVMADRTVCESLSLQHLPPWSSNRGTRQIFQPLCIINGKDLQLIFSWEQEVSSGALETLSLPINSWWWWWLVCLLVFCFLLSSIIGDKCHIDMNLWHSLRN